MHIVLIQLPNSHLNLYSSAVIDFIYYYFMYFNQCAEQLL